MSGRNQHTWKPGQLVKGAGGPSKVLTRDGYSLVTKLAALDKAQATIAHAVGISSPTWHAMLKRDPKLVEAYERGKAQARDTYVAVLQRQGKKAFVPNMFLLKTLHSFIEGAQPDAAHTNITINLPGAAPLAEYRPPKLIENDDE